MRTFIEIILRTSNTRGLKSFINKILIKYNLKPLKVVTLATGIIVEHYTNGDIKVINTMEK